MVATVEVLEVAVSLDFVVFCSLEKMSMHLLFTIMTIKGAPTIFPVETTARL